MDTTTTTNEAPIDDLDVIAKEIEAEHLSAEECAGKSLEHARQAGTKLVFVQSRLRGKGFVKWVQEKTGIPPSTCYLYIKIAKEWNRLPDFQRVGKGLSLREASQFLRMDDEECEATTVQLVGLGILQPRDIEGLGTIATRTLVTELLALYRDNCFEVD